MLHWFSLVLPPLVILAWTRNYPSTGALLLSIGLDRASASRGFPRALILGLAFQALQLLYGKQRSHFFDTLSQPLGFLLPLTALVLLLGTVATTEDVFIRGTLQSRLSDRYGESLHCGLPGGVTLGLVYWRSGRNLVATITLHALIDLVPATRASMNCGGRRSNRGLVPFHGFGWCFLQRRDRLVIRSVMGAPAWSRGQQDDRDPLGP